MVASPQHIIVVFSVFFLNRHEFFRNQICAQYHRHQPSLPPLPPSFCTYFLINFICSGTYKKTCQNGFRACLLNCSSELFFYAACVIRIIIIAPQKKTTFLVHELVTMLYYTFSKQWQKIISREWNTEFIWCSLGIKNFHPSCLFFCYHISFERTKVKICSRWAQIKKYIP